MSVLFQRWSLLAAGMLLCCGCASIFEGSKYRVRVTAEPGGTATATVNGQPVAFGSQIVDLDKRYPSHVLGFRENGAEVTQIQFHRRTNWVWPVLNIFWGPVAPVAWYWDWRTAAVYTYHPKAVHVSPRR